MRVLIISLVTFCLILFWQLFRLVDLGASYNDEVSKAAARIESLSEKGVNVKEINLNGKAFLLKEKAAELTEQIEMIRIYFWSLLGLIVLNLIALLIIKLRRDQALKMMGKY